MIRSIVQSYMRYVRGERFSVGWSFLVLPSFLVGLGVRIVDFFYCHGLRRVQEPRIPVISVGNLSYGGTNKTPFVEMLCRAMLERGVQAGIVSRGYGGENSQALLIDAGSDRRTVGDEPLLLAARMPNVPVVVSPDRLKGLEALAAQGVELAVADDAFQHRRMGRDVDIVLVDAACPFGRGLLIPAGILREPLSALRRAHMVVITKADQAPPEALKNLKEKLAEYVSSDRIFDASLAVVDWVCWNGTFQPLKEKIAGRRGIAFSAIGNPSSFTKTLEKEKVEIVAERHFRDHHLYTVEDVNELVKLLQDYNADFLVCTEKDLYNLPSPWNFKVPLWVPRVESVLNDPDRFMDVLVACLRPRLVVASNGYGEDAIGVLLAKKLQKTFPDAEVLAFPLVGEGTPYRDQNIAVVSTPSVTPSGGVLKYRFRDLWGDIRAGLFGHIRKQLEAWRKIKGTLRTPICVGDVYLLLHTLWGLGLPPLFVATAKTVYLSGHWRLERWLIRHFSCRTWTRDSDSAKQLSESQASAVYAGNPIMDLLGGAVPVLNCDSLVPLVLLLPGSRIRAYRDVGLLLSAVELLNQRVICDYLLVLAPTLDLLKLANACPDWSLEKDGKGGVLCKQGIRIILSPEDVATAASKGARLLIGLGGTANQLCAGMGIPVVSIDEKGKRVQKKLLGEAEILVSASPEALADCALDILSNSKLHKKMSEAGKERMGEQGALDDVVEYASSQHGWRMRCMVYAKLKKV